MIYYERPPTKALKDHIQCFWIMQSSPNLSTENNQHCVLPDCCADIIFDFTGIRAHSPAYVVGTMTRPLFFSTNSFTDLLGIRFKPGGIRAFLHSSLDQCTDLAADLSCFWGHSGTELWEWLGQEDQTVQRIAKVEAYLIKKYHHLIGIDPYINYCVKLIENRRGTTNSKELEIGTGLSSRQIERKFKREIGVGPKEFARIVRFQSIIKQASACGSPNWNEIAHSHGYSDQSHLIREFKAFSGSTPSLYVAQNH